MEKILRKLIEYGLVGVDKYTHNGSTWLIFTDNKQWVIELTESKTLWYNYTFFKSLFNVATEDVVENQQYITKWVEDNIINKVNYTEIGWHQYNNIDDTIERGVKKTKGAKMKTDWSVEDTIENGVRHTDYWGDKRTLSVEGTLENGVRETNPVDVMKFFDNKMEDTLENGVKETSHRQFLKTYDIKDTIQDGTQHDCWILDGCDDPVDEVLDNGVKITSPLQSREYTGDIDEVLGNGIKSSIPRQYVGEDIIDKIINKGITDTIEYDWDIPTDLIKDVITEGVKETYEDVYHHKGRIDGVIKNGVKKTMAGNYTDPSTSLIHIKWETQIEEVIDNGNKVCGTYVDGHRQEEKTETVIENGVKETLVDISDMNNYFVDDTIQNGELVTYEIDWEVSTDLIENKVKETLSWNDSIIGDLNQNGCIDTVINNGVKETKGDTSQNPMGKVTKVIKEGIKNPTV